MRLEREHHPKPARRGRALGTCCLTPAFATRISIAGWGGSSRCKSHTTPTEVACFIENELSRIFIGNWPRPILLSNKTGRRCKVKCGLSGFLLYMLMGGVGTVAHYAVLIVGVAGMGRDAIMASMLGACVGAVVNYGLNYRITFYSSVRHRTSAPKFFLIAGIGVLLNGLLMQLLVSVMDMNYMAAQIVTTCVLLITTYRANSLWTFGTRNRKEPHSL